MIKEIIDFKNALQREGDLTDVEAFQIAAQIQKNRLFRDAFLVDSGKTALEAIAMCLGQDGNYNSSIPEVLNRIAESLEK